MVGWQVVMHFHPAHPPLVRCGHAQTHNPSAVMMSGCQTFMYGT
jgi:hypothetical protein